MTENAKQHTELEVLKNEIKIKDHVASTHISFESLGKLRGLNLLSTSAPAGSCAVLTKAEVQTWDCARVQTFMKDEVKVPNSEVFAQQRVDGPTLLECTLDDLLATPFSLVHVKAKMVLKALASAKAE